MKYEERATSATNAGYADGYAAGRAAALAELRAEHQARLDASKPGAAVLCTVCGSRCSSYRRKLNGGMAATAVKLYRLGKGPAMEWVNVVQLFPNTTHRGGEWAQIRHWGLAMPRDKRSAGKNSPGDWQLTPSASPSSKDAWRSPRTSRRATGSC